MSTLKLVLCLFCVVVCPVFLPFAPWLLMKVAFSASQLKESYPVPSTFSHLNHFSIFSFSFPQSQNGLISRSLRLYCDKYASENFRIFLSVLRACSYTEVSVLEPLASNPTLMGNKGGLHMGIHNISFIGYFFCLVGGLLPSCPTCDPGVSHAGHLFMLADALVALV